MTEIRTRRLYMMISNDIFELPLAVADSVNELAEMVGATPDTIRSCICKYERGERQHSIYVRVTIEDDGDID